MNPGHAGTPENTVWLSMFGKLMRVDVDEPEAKSCIGNCFSAFRTADITGPVALSVTVEKSDAMDEWVVQEGQATTRCSSLSDLLYVVEKTLTVNLQHLRRDLYFIHAAVVARGSRSVVLIGASGVGKSTLCWTLCKNGFSYLSDELAPIDTTTLAVIPYPHALCLKKYTDGMPGIPANSIDLIDTLHIPCENLAAPRAPEQHFIDRVIFLTNEADVAPCARRDIGAAEATTRIYANSLNPLAHDNDGLAVARRIGSTAQCTVLNRGPLEAMRDAIVAGLA